MELIHVELSSAEVVAGTGPIMVRHRSTGLASVLDDGEEVVVTDSDGEFHAGIVLSVDPVQSGDDDPTYALHVGARLPMEMAAQRLADVDLLPENQGLHDIVDLLGELRRSPDLRQQP
ncbi:hypothetical protein SAMN04487968_108195 [Nocardioides terrae]|uniref:Uncharacterized protein n=1 Tax=Nocardioides terrae TaxID=574651 RepID=A0A1I1KKC6_9ACTN|nr:hypothetical protein [Nocardioides terrae]SFC61219.1 hypothetical protein SAMN04487968_108195 [Nocardioides terrae]